MCHFSRLRSASSIGQIGVIAALLIGVTLGLLSVQELRAATITVTNTNDSGAGSLRQAITNAAPGDTLVFDPGLRGATITLTSSELSINKRLSINGPGAHDLTISGNNARRIFNVGSGGIVTISGLTIANGYVNGASGGAINNAGSLTLADSVVTQSRVDGSAIGVTSRGGGGIYNSGFLTVTRSTISNNADVYYSAGGGGIYNAGTLHVEASTVSGNQVHTTSTYGPYGGGGICNQQTAVITESHILNNTATGYSYGGGGGIYNNGSLVMAYSTASGNSANDTFGGGLVNMMSGTLTLEYSTIAANQTTEDGGGIENAGILTITHSTITGNEAQGTAYGGGGLDNTEGAIVIENSTFSGNTTAANGGGIHDYDGAIALSYSTITSNTARLGGGIYLTGTITDTMLEVSNSIVANSLASTDCGVYSGTITTTITLIEDNTCNATFKDDPQLGPLQNNGGDTETHALQNGSPAIDQGNCNGLTVDQRGYTRPIDIPDIANAADGCDLGAFEMQYVDLLPIKVVNDSQPLPGQLITYTITVQNIGFSTAREAVISDTIDSRLTLGPITLDPPGAGIIGAPPTLVSGLEIAVGERITVTLPATIGLPLAANTTIANSASATATDLVAPKLGTVNITIRNAAPAPADDVETATEDAAITIHPLANDTDINGDTLSIVAIGTPIYGHAAIDGAQAIVYAPINRLADYADVFTYTVSDGSLLATGHITVNVTADNDPLMATDTITTTTEDASIQARTTASDPDTNDILSYSLTGSPVYGSASVSATTGTWIYTPTNRTSNYTAVFTVTVADSGDHTGTATITVNVTADNDTPMASDATTSTNEDTAATGTLVASDPDTNEALSYALTTQPAIGAASIDATTATWIYTPTNRTANYTAVFTATATDAGGRSDPATITVNVTADNDPLTASADVATATNEDTAINGTVTATDPDTNDTTSFSVTTNPNFGTASINSNTGAWTYTPANRMADYTAVFTITVADTGSHTDPVRITVDVSADNDPVTASDVNTATEEDAVLNGTLTVTDPDTDDTPTYAITTNPNLGAATINSTTGAWSYTPINRMADYTAVFTVTVTDSASHSDPARVSIAVSADNDEPTANDATASTNEDTATNGTISASDPDTNDTLSYAITTNPNYGAASVNAATGAWVYTPTNRTATYTAVFTVTVTDTDSHADPARVTVNVTADNDEPTAPDAIASTDENTTSNGTIIATDPDTNDTLSYAITTNPVYGTASVNATTGAWTYTPINRMADYTAVFTVTVTDSASHADPARVTVNVTADNDSPTASDATASTNEDTATNGGISATDPDTNDTLSYAITTDPNFGTASINTTTGAWTYTPINRTANYTAVFTVTVTDSASHTDPARVTVNVTADNDGPTANDATTSTNEDTAANGTIVASDPDTNDTLSYAVTTNPVYGTASINATTGAWTYTPINRMANYTAIFTVTVTDVGGRSDPATITVNVTADNDGPTASDATTSTNEDTAANGTIVASDPDTNDTLSYAITTNPVYGTASINAATGAWTYTPINRMANYTAIFTVTVTDSASHSDPARVTVNVTADNDGPTANNATVSANEDAATNGTITASDPDTDDTLSYAITTDPNLGAATISSTTGAWSYTPINRMADYTAVFTVTVTDSASHSDPARVTVNVTADNDGPTADDATASTDEDTATNGAITATDPDTNDTLSYAITTNPNYGAASVNAATGAWVYTPTNRTATYTAVFTITVTDTDSHADPARVTVNVTADNDEPTANDATASTNEDTMSNGTIIATDPDTNDTLSYAITTNPVYGTASINTTTGAWIYTPINRMANYTAIFTVTVTDSANHADPARLTVNVSADNDGPTTDDATASTNEDTATNGAISATDPDTDDALSYAITTNPNFGTASINATTGAWTYTPINRTANYTAIFTVTVTDSASHTDPARVTVNVTADNDGPTASDATTSTNEDTATNGTIVASDPDTNDTLSYAVTSNPVYGTASVNATTGAWTYTPINRITNYTAIFTVTVTDSASHTDPARVTVNVTADNDGPTANDATTSTNEDTAANGTVVASDPDTNDTLSYAVITSPAYGSASINASTGAWTYTPINRTANYTAIFTVTVTDSASHADPARVTVNVTADNDGPTANDATTSTNEDTTSNGTIVASDPDTNDTLSYAVTTSPVYGTASINASTGAWTYTPINRMASYTAVFTVTVTDSASHADPARVTVNVTADNDGPTANDATASTNEDTAANGTIVASDPDTNDTLSYAVTTSPAYGTASINATTGAWTYTPINRMANYTAIFTVTVTDSASHTDPARVTVNVTTDNDGPTANDATTSTNEDTAANGTIVASDPDTDDTLSYAVTTNPAYGSASINATTGAWTYTPINRMANYTAIFTVTVTDSASHSDPARVTVNVTADNDGPTANDATASTNEDTATNGTIVASDPDTNDTLSYAIAANPVYGTASVNATTGAWTYTPINRMANYTAIFTVTVTDSASHADPARVTVNVTADNDGPAANDATASTNEDTATNGTIVASDPDTNDTLSYAVTTSPAYGTATINATTGAWTYTPINRMANYTAIFTATVTDSASHTDPARVTVNVTADNDSPTTSDATASTNEDAPINGTLVAGDPDNNDTLTYSVTSTPNYGTARVNGVSGAWTYTPTNRTVNYAGVFTITVADTGGHTAPARVTVNVTADNDPITAGDIITTTTEGTPITGTISVSDPDTNDTASFALTGLPIYGVASVNAASGRWVYTPTNQMTNYTAVFTTTVSDTGGHTAFARITVNVTAHNEPPTVADAVVATNEDASITGTLLATDPDTFDTLSYSMNSAPRYGNASINATTGAWVYTPTNRTGSYTTVFTLAVTDAASHTVLGTITVTVAADNDPLTASSMLTATDETAAITGTIVANDPDTDDTLTYALTYAPEYGNVNVNPTTGTWVYTPTDRMANYTSIFTVTVGDTGTHTTAARITINVSADNDTPTASNATASTNEDAPLTGTIAASDPDTNDMLSYAITINPVIGTAIVNVVNGDWVYTPTNRTADYTAVFTVTVTDTGGHVVPARITVNVTADNDAPTTGNVTAATDEDTSTTGTIAASEPDTNDTLTYSITGDPNYGSANVNHTTGAWMYTPTNRVANYTAVFTITVADSGHNTADVTLTLQVSANNDAPEFATQPVTTTSSGRMYVYTILITDPDTDDTLTVSAVLKPDWLTLIDHGDGTAGLSGTPANRDAGSHVVELNVMDHGGLAVVQRFTLAVTARVYLPVVVRK